MDRIFSIVPDRCQILLYEKQGQPEAPARPVSDAEPGGRTGKRSPNLYQGNPALCCHLETGRGSIEPADQQDPDRRGQEGGRSEGAESQDRL